MTVALPINLEIKIMDKHTIEAYLKVGNKVWCEGAQKNIYDIAKEKEIPIGEALNWLRCYWLDHN